MARKLAFLGLGPTYYNIFRSRYAQVSNPATAVIPAGMEAEQLQNDEPSEVARLVSLDPRITAFRFGFLRDIPVDGVAAINLNLTSAGLYRFHAPTGSLSQGTAPDAIVGISTNITGVVGNVDEDISSGDGSSTSDGAYIVPTSTSSLWQVRFSFNALLGTPLPGAHRCMFLLRVAKVGTVIDAYPSIAVDLFESGSLVRSLGKRAVSQADQVLIFTFDAAELATASGANIEVQITSYPNTSGGYCKLDTVRLVHENAASTLDTGWLESPFTDDELVAPSRSVDHFYATQQTIVAGSRTFYVHVADDQTTHLDPSYDDSAGPGVFVRDCPLVPDGYVQMGCVVGGPALFLSRGFKRGGGPNVKVITEERGGVTEGGQTYAADSFRRRALTGDLIVTRDEDLALMYYLDWSRGHSGAFYMATEPDIDATYRRFNSFWATLKDGGESAPFGNKYTGNGADLFVRSIAVEEKL